MKAPEPKVPFNTHWTPRYKNATPLARTAYNSPGAKIVAPAGFIALPLLAVWRSRAPMPNAENTEAQGRSRHYPILDALRIILAFWVAVGHKGMIPIFAGADATGFANLIARGWNTFVFATPAVIVFFVISGFCIHLPFIGNEKLAVGRYYLRRYTRILIPVAGALAVYRLWGQHLVLWGEHSILWESPLWSLACEEIYYAAYPLLRWTRNRFDWKRVLPAAFVAGTATALTHPHATVWHVYGPFGTALLLLPVWLLGCLLAEQSEALATEVTTTRIWCWRFLAWLGCWTAEMLHFKAGIPYTQTMIWFGVLGLLLGAPGDRLWKRA